MIDNRRKIPAEDHLKIVEEYVKAAGGVTYNIIATRYGVSRERIRQIIQKSLPIQAGRIKVMEKNRLREIKEAKEYKETHAQCECGRIYITTYKTLMKRRHKNVSHLCNVCYKKIRAKLSGYYAQRRWQKEHPEQVKKGQKQYYLTHKTAIDSTSRFNSRIKYWKDPEAARDRYRAYFLKNKDHIREYWRQRRIIRNLVKKDK